MMRLRFLFLILLPILIVGCRAQPTITPAPTPSLTITPAPTLTPTPTLPPTPTKEELRAAFKKLLQSNGNCEFPCWWGFTPGQTSWETLNASFKKNHFPTHVQNATETWIDISLLDPDWDYGKILFIKQQNTLVGVQIEGRSGYINETFQISLSTPNTYLKQFELSQLLSRYGEPSQVYMMLQTSSHGDRRNYYLWVEYAARGLLVTYSGHTPGNYNNSLIYLQENAVQDIQIQLMAPGSTFTDSLKLFGDIWGYKEENGHPLQGISTTEFYETFRDPNFSAGLHFIDAQFQGVQPEPYQALYKPEEDAGFVDQLPRSYRCRLPCWLGITPGKTTPETAQQTFLSLGKAVERVEQEEAITQYNIGLFGRYDGNELDYVVQQELLTYKGIVRTIAVEAKAPTWRDSRYQAQDWAPYYLPAMLKSYGPPKQVLLYYHDIFHGSLYFLSLWYPQKGILIRYTGPVERKDGKVYVCPAKISTQQLLLCLSAPRTDTTKAPGCKYGQWDNLPPNNPIDPHAFYQTYQDPQTTDCLELPELTEPSGP